MAKQVYRGWLILSLTGGFTFLWLVLRAFGVFQSLELSLYDRLWIGRKQAQWDENIVIVGYTDSDRQKYGHYPPDDILAQVLAKISQNQPTTIGLFYWKENPSVDREARRRLAQIIRSEGVIQSTNGDRFPNEPDSIIRRWVLYNPDFQPSTTWAIARDYLLAQGIQIKESPRQITLMYPKGKVDTWPRITPFFDGGYELQAQQLYPFEVLISWTKDAKTYYYSFEQILEKSPKKLRNKIVLIGSRSVALKQIFKVPSGSEEVYKSYYDVQMIGVVISNLLQQNFIQTWGDLGETLYFLGWMIISGASIWLLIPNLEEKRSWVKFLAGLIFSYVLIVGLILLIAMAVFPALWIPSGWVILGVSLNLGVCALVISAVTVTQEQQKVIREKAKRLAEQERYNQRLKSEVDKLKNTLLAQERLVFIGRISPFLRHKLLNYYGKIELNIASSEINLNTLENSVSNLLLIVEETKAIDNDELEEYTESLNTIEEIKNTLSNQRSVLQLTSRVLDRFLPMLRTDLPQSYSKPDWVSLNVLLKESSKAVFFDFKTFYRDFKVNLVLELDDKLPEFYCIASEIQFTFVNIVENAYHAVWEKSEQHQDSETYEPTIKISSTFVTNKIVLKIADNGVGISVTQMSQIFEPFFTTKTKLQQTGVGLTLAKDIIEQHYHGRIWVTNEYEFTNFIIEFPLDTPLP